MSANILNPNWLLGARVVDTHGKVMGRVTSAPFNGSVIVDIQGTKHKFNANSLDGLSCIENHESKFSKYITLAELKTIKAARSTVNG